MRIIFGVYVHFIFESEAEAINCARNCVMGCLTSCDVLVLSIHACTHVLLLLLLCSAGRPPAPRNVSACASKLPFQPSSLSLFRSLPERSSINDCILIVRLHTCTRPRNTCACKYGSRGIIAVRGARTFQVAACLTHRHTYLFVEHKHCAARHTPFFVLCCGASARANQNASATGNNLVR